ncbi:MAG: hypothetical protein Q9191_005897 [Dirinaria sp. TL-2023a]
MSPLLLCLTFLGSAFAATTPAKHSHPVSGLEQRAADHRPVSFQQRNLNTITNIYKRNLYPTNLEFVTNGTASVPPGLFNEKATGRITPLGNFTGFNDSTEYFFALSPVPQPPTYVGFSKIQIVSFQSECPNVASSVVYITGSVFHPGSPDDGKFVSTLKQIAFWEFDNKGAVLKYDAWIPNLALYNAIGRNDNSGNVTAAQTQAATIQTLCGEVQKECTGSNTQYSSTQNCIETLSAKPFGNWDEVWMDSVVCRELHILLARVDPLTHCPHVGPTGGDKCVNEPYEAGYFLSDQALFGKPEGQNFVCHPIPQ